MVEERLGFTAVAVLSSVFFQERPQQLPLLKLQQPLKPFLVFFEVLLCFFGFVVVFRIVEHGGTHTVLSFLAHQDLIVHTALAAGPESFILGQFRVGNRLVAQFAVDLHDRQAGGQPEYLGFGVFFPGKFEDAFFDGLRHTAFAVGRRYDQAAVSHVFAMAPGFNITEADPLILAGNGDHSFAFVDLLFNVIRAAGGDTGSAGGGRCCHFISDRPGVHFVRDRSYPDDYFLIIHVDEKLR